MQVTKQLRFFRAFSSVVRQTPGQNPQRRGTARTLPNFCVVLCIVCFVSFCLLFLCICVLYYCHPIAVNKYIKYISRHLAVRSFCLYRHHGSSTDPFPPRLPSPAHFPVFPYSCSAILFRAMSVMIPRWQPAVSTIALGWLIQKVWGWRKQNWRTAVDRHLIAITVLSRLSITLMKLNSPSHPTDSNLISEFPPSILLPPSPFLVNKRYPVGTRVQPFHLPIQLPFACLHWLIQIICRVKLDLRFRRAWA